MKKLIIILTVLLLALTNCDTTDPKPPEEKPPGYQEDIPWPSLADSPWPRVNGNPQNACRTNETANIMGEIEWVKKDSLDLHAGIVVGKDSTIYIASQPYFFALTTKGEVKWRLNLGFSTLTTPLLTSENEIICYYDSPTKIYSLSPDGHSNWELQLNFGLDGQLNIGKTGEIYFIDESTLFAVKDGLILWSLSDPEIRRGSTISPDGKFLYAVGIEKSLIKIDLENRTITDKIGAYTGFSLPLVDSKGNVYFSSVIENYNSNNPALFCLNSDLEILWFFGHNQYKTSGSRIKFFTSQIAMDKLGNIFFGNDTVYSVSPSGDLNWKYVPDTPIGSPFIIDGDQDLYLVKDYGNSFGITILSNDGTPLLDTPSNAFEGNSSRFSCVLFNSKLIVPTQDKYLYSIK